MFVCVVFVCENNKYECWRAKGVYFLISFTTISPFSPQGSPGTMQMHNATQSFSSPMGIGFGEKPEPNGVVFLLIIIMIMKKLLGK